MKMDFIFDQTYTDRSFDFADIRLREFENCAFINCDFTACDFLGTTFTDSSFTGCNFKEAAINYVGLRDCSFQNCDFTSVNFAMVDQTIFEFRFDSCCLDFCQFYGLDLKRTTFANCSLIGADFMETILKEVLFDNCNLHQAVFLKANAEKADFYTSYNYDIDPDKTNIKRAVFSRSGLEGLLKKHVLVLK